MMPVAGARGWLGSACLAATAAALAWSTLACTRQPPQPIAIGGHPEVSIEPDGGLVALFLGPASLRVCVQVPADDLTARWQADLDLGRAGSTDWLDPVSRVAGIDGHSSTLCFADELPAPDAPRRLRVCGDLRDQRRGTVRPLACQQVLQRPDDARYRALGALLANSRDPRLLREQARVAEQAGYPVLAVRMLLGAVYYLRLDGTPEALTRARAVETSIPSWPERGGDVVAVLAGFIADMRGLERLGAGDLPGAWQAFLEARRRYAVTADPRWISVSLRKSSLLEKVGAYGEARRELDRALGACQREETVCDPRVLHSLAFQRAWLDAIDEDAEPEALRAAAATFEASVDADHGDALKRANHAVNLALVRQRLGEDARPALASAERMLDDDQLPFERRRLLRGWIRLLRAQDALRNARFEQADALCQALAEESDDLQLVALAFDCAARALQRAGDLEAAAERYRRAIAIWRFATPRQLQQDIALGTGKHAATVYRAAQLAVDRGQPAAADRLLRELDHASVSEALRRQCRAAATGEDARRWHRVAQRSAELLEELRHLDRPGPGAQEARRQQRRREVGEELVALQRELPGCQEVEETERLAEQARPAQVRTFALEHEVITLFRRPDGTLDARRTPLERRAVRRLAQGVQKQLARHEVDDAAWRQQLMPIARALIEPALEAGTSRVTFALHGALQAIPIAALPIPDQSGWLIDRIIPVLRPAATGRSTHAHKRPDRPPLVVVNPTGELRVKTPYRTLIPDAEVLERQQGTRQAVRARLAVAGWFHIDTHGYYDPAFAELSHLALADGRLGLADVRAWSADLWLANLSGCQTGRWPVTADSGRFGIGGVVAAGNVEWAIASRATLINRWAEAFNAAFYRALGDSVPQAYGTALRRLSEQGARAVEWAALMLLEGNGGQQAAHPSPGARGAAVQMGRGEGGNPARRILPPFQKGAQASLARNSVWDGD